MPNDKLQKKSRRFFSDTLDDYWRLKLIQKRNKVPNDKMLPKDRLQKKSTCVYWYVRYLLEVLVDSEEQ